MVDIRLNIYPYKFRFSNAISLINYRWSRIRLEKSEVESFVDRCDEIYFLDSHRVFPPVMWESFSRVQYHIYTNGKIILFLKTAKNVLVKIGSVSIGSKQKRDRRFIKCIYVHANRAAELRSSGQRRGRRRGVKNDPDWGGQEVTTWTHVRSTGRTGSR